MQVTKRSGHTPLSRFLLPGLAAVFWGLAAGVLLPSQLSALGPHILPPEDAGRHWRYAVGAAFPAALVAGALTTRVLQPQAPVREWVRGWLLIGVSAGLGAIAGGALIWAGEGVLGILPRYSPEAYGGYPAWMGVPMSLVMLWFLGVWSTLGIAALDGALLALASLPLLLGAYALSRHREPDGAAS